MQNLRNLNVIADTKSKQHVAPIRVVLNRRSSYAAGRPA